MNDSEPETDRRSIEEIHFIRTATCEIEKSLGMKYRWDQPTDELDAEIQRDQEVELRSHLERQFLLLVSIFIHFLQLSNKSELARALSEEFKTLMRDLNGVVLAFEPVVEPSSFGLHPFVFDLSHQSYSSLVVSCVPRRRRRIIISWGESCFYLLLHFSPFFLSIFDLLSIVIVKYGILAGGSFVAVIEFFVGDFGILGQDVRFVFLQCGSFLVDFVRSVLFHTRLHLVHSIDQCCINRIVRFGFIVI